MSNTYQAKPVRVLAQRISKVEAGPGRSWIGCKLTLEDGSEVHPTPEMLARMAPAVGDYWVIQEDGYIYLNPKAVFERKYSPVPDDFPAAAC